MKILSLCLFIACAGLQFYGAFTSPKIEESLILCFLGVLTLVAGAVYYEVLK